MLFAEIQYRIRNAKQLDFGAILSNSIELFKEIWVQGLVTVLLSIGLSIPFVIVVYVPLIFLGVIDETNPTMIDDVAPLLALVLIFAYLLLMVSMMVITLALKAALYRIMFQKDMKVPGSEDYFFFLKKPYLGKTISIAFVYLGIIILATLLCFLPVFYVLVPLNLLVVIYAFNPDLTVNNLLKASFELGNKKWFITFGLILITGFLAQLVGFLMCLIGVLVTSSFVGVPLYFIYKEVIGFENNAHEVKEIENDTNFNLTN